MRPTQSGQLVEVRVHGRGGQGGVTCAKIVAALYAECGKSVQTFGDYAAERSGAPVRAYTRISDSTIHNRNKVYRPNHVLVLDPTLLGADVLSGLAPGGTVIVNSPKPAEAFDGAFGAYRLVTVDATAIARKHKIGTRSVVIVNTTIAGAFARAFDLPIALVESVYEHLGLSSNLAAAKEAYEAAKVREPAAGLEPFRAPAPQAAKVVPLVENLEGLPPGLKTGSWRTQAPRYVKALAPCSARCPAGNDVVGFVQALAREEDEAHAAEVLARTTPFAGVCGRVCPAFCMQGCNRAELDGAVNVRALERWISDHAQSTWMAPERKQGALRIAVVGSGPAGLSAARTLALEGHAATIVEKESALGGVLRTGIPAYRLPRDVLDREVQAVMGLGVESRVGEAVDAERLAALAKEFDAVIVATGLQRLRSVDGPGGKLKGVEQGIHFLHRVNLEGGSKLSGHVVVLGGGNTAMDCARTAVRQGAKKVTVAYRRSREEMPANAEEIEQAMDEGVEFVFLRAPLGFSGRGKLEAVNVAEVELGPPDASGRRSPVVTNRKSALKCKHVLLALGQSADLSLLPKGWEVKDGRVHASGEPLRVFVAGDVGTSAGTVTHAIGDGRRVALLALRALGQDVALPAALDLAAAVKSTDVRLEHFERRKPSREREAPAGQRIRAMAREVSRGLASAAEAKRCFSCGDCTSCDTCLVYCPEGIIHRQGTAYAVDLDYCKGCGICAAECPRKAIEMVMA